MTTNISHSGRCLNNRSISSVVQAEHSLMVVWSDGSESQYHYLWLRDNCSTAFHPDTQERDFDLLSVSEEIYPLQVQINETNLDIIWSEGGHKSSFSQTWLHQHDYSRTDRARHTSSYQSWDSSFIQRIPRADYQSVVDDNKALYQWMAALDKFGLTIVEGMPDTVESTVTLATRVDYLRQTNFGTTFDVVSVASPINLAYTSISLPLHTDLPNQETPPGYQFLHCLANECEGGESTFVDGLRVAEELREQCPDHFALLSEQVVPFRFHDKEHDIRQHHSVINVDDFGNIIEVKYNAHLASVLDLPVDVMHDYYLAYRNLMARLRDERFKIEIKLQAGQMVVFDNRRVLHGRNQFEDKGGRRHLHGCYVDRSEFKSRLRMLAEQYG
ncbi:TauD/TfdA family dioxygenase [Marinomonas pollencensis]|uniref:Gamma-butyrobetaine dioxygenase n=1 Tax=Marinomonas pollencensis TaxID=491954 RepID=A0A3E0DRT1_9GAMM|nr:TauD/TfdA family dioxygenase [Marinomonas pollencensis]REG85042.1 gamma-butyrobetaine dioxygenase [Marinomonas pollencensis]